MADPSTSVAGRYAFTGSLKDGQRVERWIGVEQDSGRRVVLAAVDSGRLTMLDAARGMKHRHLAGVIEVVRDVDASSLPSGRPLPLGFGVAVAEFVPGTTLHSELSRGGLNPSKAVAWLLRLAEAVQALHSMGAVHAGVSPRSVIAVPLGRAMAPVLSQLVAPAIGPYCPPERLRGAGESSPDDVWALHAILYTALTRRPPYSAPTRDALLKQMLSGRPKPLAEFGIDEPALQEIVDRGLAYEKRVRVSGLSELIATLDGWERDPRAMPAKRQVPPRPAPRSLMDIVGGNGLSKQLDDTIVVDGETLPEDDGTQAYAKPVSGPIASPAPLVQSNKTGASFAAAPSLLPMLPSHEALGSLSNFPATVSVTPRPTIAPKTSLTKRTSINPFERKRSIWPLVIIAAIFGGGGVYLAVLPDGSQSLPKAEQAVPPALQPRLSAPERPKLSPAETRDACVASYFDSGALEPAQNFAFLCGDGDFRELAVQLERQVRSPPTPGSDAGSRASVEAKRDEPGVRGSGLDWYGLPAAAIIRRSCCEGATPVILPETVGWCEQLQTVVRRIAENSGKSGDLAPDARSFDKAVSCLFANKVGRLYGYDKAPSDANRRAFQQFLSRAAISEARR